MAASNTVRINIIGDASSAKRAMADTEASLRRLEGTAAKSQEQLGGISDAFDSFGNATAMVAGATAITASLNQIVQSASRLEQSQGAIDAVFKSQAGSMREAASAANDLGISQAEYGEMATRLGSQLKNLGVAQSSIVPQTQNLIQLGADLAATYGGTTADAVQALSALFRGEVDPIERYGVSIKQAQVSALASAEGITEAQARMKLLMQQTSDVQGQWAREQGTFAVESQKAAAAFEDMKASLGTGLLPIITPLMEAFGGLGKAIGAIPQPVTNAATQMALFFGATRGLNVGLGMAAEKMQDYAAKLNAMGEGNRFAAVGSEIMGNSLEKNAGRIANGAMAIGAAVVAWQLFSDTMADGVANVEEMTAALEDLAASQSALDMNTDTGGVGGFVSDVDSLNEALDQLQSSGSVTNFAEALAALGQTKDIMQANTTLENYIKTLEGLARSDAGEASRRLLELQDAMSMRGMDTSQLDGVRRILEESGFSAQDAAEGLSKYEQSLVDSATAAKDFASAVESALGPMKELQGIALGQREASRGWHESYDRLAESVKKYGQNLNQSSEGGRANAEALDRFAASSTKYVESANNINDAVSRMKQSRQAFVDMAQAAGMSRDAAQKLANQLQLIPKNVKTLFPNDADKAISQTEGLNAALARVAGVVPITFTIDAQVSAAAQQVIGGSGLGSFGGFGGTGRSFADQMGVFDPAITGDWDENHPDLMAAAAAGIDRTWGGMVSRAAQVFPGSGSGGTGWLSRALAAGAAPLQHIKVPISYDFFMQRWNVDKSSLEHAIESARAKVEQITKAKSEADDRLADRQSRSKDWFKGMKQKLADLSKGRKAAMSGAIDAIMNPAGLQQIDQASRDLKSALEFSKKTEAKIDAINKKMRQRGKEDYRAIQGLKQRAAEERVALDLANKEVAAREKMADLFDKELERRQQYIKYVEEELSAIGQMASKINGVSIAGAFAEVDKVNADIEQLTEKMAEAWHPAHIDYYTKKIQELQATADPGKAVEAHLTDTIAYGQALQALQSQGVGDAFINEIVAMGPKEGLKIAQALVNNDALRAQFQVAVAGGLQVSQDTATKLRGSIYANTYSGTLVAMQDAYTAYDAWVTKQKGGKKGEQGAITVNVTGALDPGAVARQIRQILREEERRVGARR